MDFGIRVSDILASHALLTRLPMPRAVAGRGARAAWAWPIVGLTVGGLAAAAAALALAAGVPPAAAAGLALAASILVTGALHEDGLADSADGLWGGWDRVRRLEILRDSHVGSYGVIALILSLGLRWSALAALAADGDPLTAVLVAAAILSRAAMAVVAARLPHARGDGLSVATGRPPTAAAAAAAALALVLALVVLGAAAIAAALAAALAAAVPAGLARARIGGQTGDILGAVQQVAEIAVLLTLAATL